MPGLSYGTEQEVGTVSLLKKEMGKGKSENRKRKTILRM